MTMPRVADTAVGGCTSRAMPRASGGCGHWLTNAFDPDYGRPENRLNAQRYALGGALADFSVALPAGMDAEITTRGGTSFAQFVPARSDGAASSVFLYDVASALRRGVSTYVYREMGARGPVQTGTWEGGRARLLPPGSRITLP